MSSKSVTRATIATLLALGLSVLLFVQSVAAASWAAPVQITPNEVSVHDGCRSGDSALAAYVSFYDYVAVKRSNDGGASWMRQVKIEQGLVSEAAIACRGRMVDAVWINSYRARYANSDDRGRSFEAGRRISTKQDDEVIEADVARGPNGVVAVVWWNQNSDGYPDVIVNRVRARISLDGGETFAPTVTIGRGVAPSVAVGDGVVYVAYRAEDSNALVMRRSLNGGNTWRPPVTIAANTLDWPDVVAQGSEAYVGFTRGTQSGHRVVYRHTADKGATWSTAVPLGAKQGYGSSDLRLNLEGAMVQAAYVSCGDKHCNHFGRIMYRQSPDGVTWTAAERVAGGEFFGRGTVGRAIFSGRPIVLYTHSESTTYASKSRFRLP
jgi:hypothetical protein